MTGQSDNLGRIGVLMGGYSSEREISLKSGTAVYNALKGEGLDAAALDITVSATEAIKDFIATAKIDVAFIALHGRLGEDGAIQAILEGLGIPYPGSGVEASRLALHKHLSLDIFQDAGLRIPGHVLLDKDAFDRKATLEKVGGFPLILKPSSEGSSIGLRLVEKEEDLDSALKAAWKEADDVLMERFIKGRDLTVGILGNSALPVIEIRVKNKVFDYASKYTDNMAQHIVPAPIAPDTADEVQRMALKAHQVLGCKDFSRVDFVLDRLDHPYLLEVNTIPGFTSLSLLPEAAKYAGISFGQLCITLIRMAYGKEKK